MVRIISFGFGFVAVVIEYNFSLLLSSILGGHCSCMVKSLGHAFHCTSGSVHSGFCFQHFYSDFFLHQFSCWIFLSYWWFPLLFFVNLFYVLLTHLSRSYFECICLIASSLRSLIIYMSKFWNYHLKFYLFQNCWIQ